MITTYDQIRALGGFRDAEDADLEPFASIATSRLKKIVGEDIYNDAAEETPENAERAADIQIAEAYFVLYYALPKLNTVYIDKGGISHQGQVGDTQFKYYSPQEVEEKRQSYLNDIDTILANWIDTNFNPTVGQSPAVADYPNNS